MTSAPNHDAIEAKLDELELKLKDLDSTSLGRLLEACTPAEPELLPFLFSLYNRSLISDPQVRQLIRDQDIQLRRSLREERYRREAEADERNKLLAERLAKASYDNFNSAESSFFSALRSWFTSSTPDKSRAAVRSDEQTLLLPLAIDS